MQDTAHWPATAPNQPADLYIDLLMRSLSFSIWEEPPALVSRFASPRASRRIAAGFFNTLISPFGVELSWKRNATGEQRDMGKVWPSYGHTMIGRPRLQNVRDAVETIIAEKIDGDLIETGVWRGGACILMRGILKAHGVTDRRVYVADSFAGLPPPDPKYPADKGDKHHRFSALAIPRSEVEDNFRRYGLLDDQVVMVEGFFEHTLPKLDCDRFAVIRLDGDMYSSTIQALESLYPRLSPGGYCIIDDYALPGCRKAVEDYRTANGVDAAVMPIDWTGSY